MNTKEKYRFISAPYIIDRKLYKYYSNTKYAVDCIRNRRIHLDDPRSFNDPFDAAFHCAKISTLALYDSELILAKKFLNYICFTKEENRGIHHQEIVIEYSNIMPQLLLHLSDDSIERPVIETIKKIYNYLNTKTFSLEEFINAIDKGFIEDKRVMKLNCKISCFSEIWDSILMWSYYANNHSGICIEFDMSKLDRNDELTSQIYRGMSKVQYSPIRADVQYLNTPTSGLNFLATKADVWSHEHEWRLICETEMEYLPFDCVSNVYIGVNYDVLTSEYKELVNAVNTYEGLSIKKCKLSFERYQIECEETYNSYIKTYLDKIKYDKESNHA